MLPSTRWLAVLLDGSHTIHARSACGADSPLPAARGFMVCLQTCSDLCGRCEGLVAFGQLCESPSVHHAIELVLSQSCPVEGVMPHPALWRVGWKWPLHEEAG
jgi:hypothetical protein